MSDERANQGIGSPRTGYVQGPGFGYRPTYTNLQKKCVNDLKRSILLDIWNLAGYIEII